MLTKGASGVTYVDLLMWTSNRIKNYIMQCHLIMHDWRWLLVHIPIFCWSNMFYAMVWLYTVYPKKYAHGFVVLCFVEVMQLFIMNSHEVFIHIHQGCFAGTGAIVRLPQCQWSKPDGYGKISQCKTTTKHSKAVTVCIFLGIYYSFISIGVDFIHSIGIMPCIFWIDTYVLNNCVGRFSVH